MKPRPAPGLLVGMALISAAALVVEIALTRICSVAIWYHFAFLIISLAMLGYGASGAVLAVSGRLRRMKPSRLAARLSLFFAAACVLAPWLMGATSFDPFRLAREPAQALGLAVYVFAMIPPFFLAGLCAAVLLSGFAEAAGQLYFANLAGAGLGCLVAVVAIGTFSNAGAALVAAAFGAAAALAFSSDGLERRTAGLAAVLLSASVPFSNAAFSPRPAKSKSMAAVLDRLGLRPCLTRWNAFSQVDVFMSGSGKGQHFVYAPGLPASISPRSLPEQAMIFIDADAGTPITRYQPGSENLRFLGYLPSSTAYQLVAKRPGRFCVIGPGGGIDVLAALKASPQADVTAVEINPDVADVVAGRFEEFSGRLYTLPNVHLRVADGRSFIRSGGDTFDVIEVSLVDTWAAIAAGAYSLTENFLYTTEAFRDYYRRLTEEGTLTMTRWLSDPPNEAMRLAALAVAALEKEGLPHPEKHIAFITSAGVATMLLKKTEFTADDVKALRRLCARRGFAVLHAPGVETDSPLSEYLSPSRRQNLLASYPYDFAATGDDRPFYFRDRKAAVDAALWAALAAVALLSVALIIAPLRALPASARPISGSSYFACLGVGFMFVEVPLTQKLILFLGNPTYSLSVVLCALLVFGGLGSLAASFQKSRPLRAQRLVLALLPVALSLYSFISTDFFSTFMGFSPAAKVGLTLALLAPAGFLMGMPMPLGLYALEERSPDSIAWAWGINGFASVLSSLLSVILSMRWGFTCVLRCAAAAYLAAWAATLARRRRPA